MLRILTAGESHGPLLTAIIEGLPAGLPLTADDINTELARRQVGEMDLAGSVDPLVDGFRPGHGRDAR